jgi:hypothetical protein
MKKLLLLPAIAIMFAACSSYQMSTLSSSTAKKDVSTGIFTVENDSLILSYNFTGEHSPVNIQVYNKLNEPLYVNWAKSALIADNQAYSYVDDEIHIKGSTSSASTQYIRRGSTFTDGTLNATAKLPKNESFVPPHSAITKTSYILQRIGINDIEKSVFKPVALTYIDGSGQFYGKTATFTVENSPLSFKSYITLYVLKDDQQRSFNLEQDFFVSKVTKSAESPENLYEFSNARGDIITFGNVTGYSKTMAVVGLAGAVGALTTAQTALADKNKPK